MAWNIWLIVSLSLAILSVVIGYYVFLGAVPASAITAFVAWLYPHDGLLQFFVFGIVFIVFIIVSPRLSQIFYAKNGNNRIGIASYKGKRALVERDIVRYADSGLVVIAGQIWSARSSVEIAAGAEVVIVDIEGNHFIVSEVC